MTPPQARRPALLLPLLLAGALSAVSACSSEGNDVQTMPQDQAKRQVQQYADKVRTAAAVDAFTQSNQNVSPCERKGGELSDSEAVYYIQGIYQLMIPAEDQAKTLAQVREQLTKDGLTIKTEKSAESSKGGSLTAVSTDEYTISLTSGQPPAMLLLVSSPCYRS